LVFLGSLGCVGLAQRVDRGALSAVPPEELLLLFDAEHDVFIARDDAELAARALQDAKAALARARNHRAVIERRRTNGGSVDSVAVLELLERWNDARIVMREREADLRHAEVDAGATRLWAARARYEREKARLVQQKNPAVGASLDLSAYVRQADEWAVREDTELRRIDRQNQIVVEARATYFTLSRQLQEASRGAYGGPWADLLD
jgi:hypothetical protein